MNRDSTGRKCPMTKLKTKCIAHDCMWGVYDAYLDEWTCAISMLWYMADPQTRNKLEDERESRRNQK